MKKVATILLVGLLVCLALPFADMIIGFLIDVAALPVFWLALHNLLVAGIVYSLIRGQRMNEINQRQLLESIKEVVQTLHRIERYLTPKSIPDRMQFFTIINGREHLLEDTMVLKQGEKAILKLRILDAGGNPATVEGGKVDWSVSDASVGTLTIAEDMMSAEFIPSGAVGKTMVQAKGDADLGEGVKELMGEIELEVLSGEAVVMELSAEAAPL